MIFLLFWTKIWVAVICNIAIILIGYSLILRSGGVEEIKIKLHDIILLMFVILFFMVICYFAGYGRFTDQPGDWVKHNAVLYDLVNKDWPVMYQNGSETSMLTYYIGQYIIPAIIGKVTHSCRIAEHAVFVWNLLGLILVWLNAAEVLHLKRDSIKIWLAVFLAFWGLPLWGAQFLLKIIYGYTNIGSIQWFVQTLIYHLQYSNNFILLRWVFPQVIVCWLAMCIFLKNREKIDYYFFIIFPVLFFGSFSFIGLVPIALIYAIYDVIHNQKSIKHIFSWENGLSFITYGVVFFFYFLGNVSESKPDSIAFHLVNYPGKQFIIYLCFISQVIVYAILLFKEHKHDVIFWVAIAELIILPFGHLGYFNDLVMRASIPALFILMMYTTEFLSVEFPERNGNSFEIRRTVCMLVVVLGLFYSFTEFSETVTQEIFGERGEITEVESLEEWANRKLKLEEDLKYNYFSYDLEKNIFYNYLARLHD